MEKDIRPWGEYVVLAEGPLYKIKQITVNPGQRLSLQRHQKRQEHWFCLRGSGSVTLNDQKISFGTGQSIDIPRTAIHRVENKGKELLEFIEIQTGESFDESDIERLEDDYQRA